MSQTPNITFKPDENAQPKRPTIATGHTLWVTRETANGRQNRKERRRIKAMERRA